MNKINNKGFSLVELIVVIAIMAVLMGVLAPTLIGNIEKSRESKDLQNLDSVYQAVNQALATEAGAKEAATTEVTAQTLSTLLASNNHTNLAKEIKEILGDVPDLTATCNAGAEIYVAIDDTTLKAYVFCSKDGTAVTQCTKTKDSSGAGEKMEVGNAPGSTPGSGSNPSGT